MSIENAEAFPLSWPIGRPRTPAHNRKPSNFWRKGDDRYSKRALSLGRERDELLDELKRLGARRVVLSTNITLRNDGLPYANAKAPADPGVAAWFFLGDLKNPLPVVLSCDRWTTVADNMHALAKHIEAMRGQERWGVGSVREAFAGYAALPPAMAMGPAKRPWDEVIGVAAHTPTNDVVSAYRRLAGELHPDRGGSHDAMAELNTAFDEFKKERGIA